MPQFGGKPKKTSSDSKRHFTVVMGGKEYGLYVSLTPSSAARKAVTKLCAANKSKKVEFHIREITQGSKKKTYGSYIGYIEKLKDPIELKGRIIKYKPVAKLSGKTNKKTAAKKGGMRGGVGKKIIIEFKNATYAKTLYTDLQNNRDLRDKLIIIGGGSVMDRIFYRLQENELIFCGGNMKISSNEYKEDPKYLDAIRYLQFLLFKHGYPNVYFNIFSFSIDNFNESMCEFFTKKENINNKDKQTYNALKLEELTEIEKTIFEKNKENAKRREENAKRREENARRREENARRREENARKPKSAANIEKISLEIKNEIDKLNPKINQYSKEYYNFIKMKLGNLNLYGKDTTNRVIDYLDNIKILSPMYNYHNQ